MTLPATTRLARCLRPAVTLVLVASLSACVVVPAGRTYGGGDVADGPPPAPQAEVVGVAPALGWLWLSGYWGWRAGRHVWIGGHWEAPRSGHHWVPHRWAPDGGRWRLNRGHWRR